MLQVPAEHSLWFEVAQRLCYVALLKNSGRDFKEGELKPRPESTLLHERVWEDWSHRARMRAA